MGIGVLEQEGVGGIGGGLGDPVVDAFEDLEPVGRIDEVHGLFGARAPEEIGRASCRERV